MLERNLLNQQGTADKRATSQMCVHTPKDDLCIPIMKEELEEALQGTRRGKAPGLDGISPEILKLGGPKLKTQLTFHTQYLLAEANTPTGL